MDYIKVSMTENEQSDFDSKMVDAWISTRMEADKSILSISSLGFGALLAYVFSNEFTNKPHYFLIFPLLSLSTCIGCSIYIFVANAEFIKHRHDITTSEKLYKKLDVLDKINTWSFILSVIILLIISIIRSVGIII